jgi:hypothetical protein
MKNIISRSPKVDQMAFDEACDDFKDKHRGMFHVAAAHTDCTYKALQSRFNTDNPAHRLGAWDLLVCSVVFNDHSLLDALLGSYFNRGSHALAGDDIQRGNVFSLLIKNNKQGSDLISLYDKFLDNDGLLDADEQAQLLAEARKGVADLQAVIATLQNLSSGVA